jgi:hypothetical protein
MATRASGGLDFETLRRAIEERDGKLVRHNVGAWYESRGG